MIVGGRTSVDQPLDISVNKQFKQICKNESIKAANNILTYLESANILRTRSNGEDESVVRSKFFFFSSLIVIVNDQILIAKKDLQRSKARQNSITNYLKRITIEDVAQWIFKGFEE